MIWNKLICFQTNEKWGLSLGSDRFFSDFEKRSEEKSFEDTESNTNSPGLAEYPYVKRSPKNDYFGFGSDGYLYDFVKRSPKNDWIILGKIITFVQGRLNSHRIQYIGYNQSIFVILELKQWTVCHRDYLCWTDLFGLISIFPSTYQ